MTLSDNLRQAGADQHLIDQAVALEEQLWRTRVLFKVGLRSLETIGADTTAEATR